MWLGKLNFPKMIVNRSSFVIHKRANHFFTEGQVLFVMFK